MTVLRTFVVILARVLNILILARVLLSWIPMDRDNPLIAFVYNITEPILGPIRRMVPSVGGLDLSPIIALVLLEVVQRVLLTMLYNVG
jgi:YggT family protein